MKKGTVITLAGIIVLLIGVFSCGGPAKVQRIQRENITASLTLPYQSDIPELSFRETKQDTVVIKDQDGRDLILMKAVKDEVTGDMVANEVINAAVVTARFRNIAERRGKVDLQFQVIVPREMQDGAWQLRFYPDMFIMEDSTRLESVVITGKDYRKAQLRGYEQYDRFLSKIVSDPNKFIDVKQLEIFLERNIPQVFAYKADTSFVSDIEFYSFYGVTE